MGFSTGACMAGILTAILERNGSCDFQKERLDANHPPLLFTICFSGFKLTHPKFRSLYLDQIQTPMLHLTGIYDFWIPQSQTYKLAEICVNGELVSFEGTHYVPGDPFVVRKVIEFIKESLGWKYEPNQADGWIDI
ncbi:hypothetical protein PMG11_11227 [Penicillium brasilianum]|uniref:Serine hydrolase domain-containing protein n=1 Tax=Penicillium brasilianum TaxID=104259 RepID=A0A0F7U3A6_PENBI|nr:hypothetical protein PMG11_11227 [Penicillium brasilianum]